MKKGLQRNERSKKINLPPKCFFGRPFCSLRSSLFRFLSAGENDSQGKAAQKGHQPFLFFLMFVFVFVFVFFNFRFCLFCRCCFRFCFCRGASVASEQQHKQDLRRIYKKGVRILEIITFYQNALRLFTRMHCAFLPECIAPSTRMHCATNITKLFHGCSSFFAWIAVETG